MSGGVDSSMAALRLQEAGWKVLGLTMRVPVADAVTHPRPCCGVEAARVCQALGIPHYFLDVRPAFDELVIQPFRRAYAEGRTPNPCVDCNRRLKFGLVWDFAEAAFGIRRLATGHYARVLGGVAQRPPAVGIPERAAVPQPGSGEDAPAFLARGTDHQRDQSYFLYGIPLRRLADFVLPVGELSKATTRALARERGLPVAEKADSQELCFAGEADYRLALAEGVGTAPGPILDTGGAVLGAHPGIGHFTLGQRHGLRVARGTPLYVVRISARDNSVTLGTRAEASRKLVAAGDVNVLMSERLRAGERLLGKCRSTGEPAGCVIKSVGVWECGSVGVEEGRSGGVEEGKSGRVEEGRSGEGKMAVEFDEAQFAPAPGQSLVLYDAEGRVVAGGVIRDA
jgi:tRNA-specific 2-thiouridylase